MEPLDDLTWPATSARAGSDDASPKRPGLLPSPELHERRERVFLILAGLFLGTLAMLNILGITRFIDLSFDLWGMTIPFQVAVGVLPYPVTFLCTDFISELYGQKRANFVGWGWG